MVCALFVFVLLHIMKSSYSAKILIVIPTPSYSHQMVFRPFTLELSRRGHEVTVITTDPAFPKGQSPANLTEVDVHDLSYTTWKTSLNAAIGDRSDLMELITLLVVLEAAVFDQLIRSKVVQDVIKQDFDLLIIEECVRPALTLSHIHKVPVIQISSFGAIMETNVKMGAPNHPLLYPLAFRRRLYNLTYWEKVRGVYDEMKYYLMFKHYESKEDEMLRNIFGPDIPTLSELKNNVDMLFLNIHPIWCDNQPMPPNVISIAGIYQAPEKELPKDIKSYLDTSKQGVIYISFGSNIDVSKLPPQKLKMMIKVLSQLPYDVLLKWDSDELDVPKNIKLFKWLPQSDLLKHPKIKLFIMQGGLHSTDESINAGVPLIGLPIFSDQWYNTEKYIKHGIGVQFDITTITEDEFKNAIITVIEDKSYRNNIVKLRTLMYDQPQAPLERAIWWTEYVLRHGGAKHLRSPAANMSWTEYYELKLVLLLVCIFVLTIYFLFYILNRILKSRRLTLLIKKCFVKYKTN